MSGLLIDIRADSSGETTWVPEEKEEIFEILRKFNQIKVLPSCSPKIFAEQMEKLQLNTSMMIDLATGPVSLTDLEELRKNHEKP